MTNLFLVSLAPEESMLAVVDPMKNLANNMSSKLEHGSFRGGVRLVCSEDILADRSAFTFAALQQEQPSSYHIHALLSVFRS